MWQVGFGVSSKSPDRWTMVWFVTVLAAIIVACTLSSARSGEVVKLPADFVGSWLPIGDEVAACPSPLPDSYSDTILTVTAKGFDIYEAAYCEVVSLETFEESVVQADFECVGMGDLWNERNIMHVASLGSQKILVIASLGMTNHRDDFGKLLLDDPAPGVGIWLKCEGPPSP